jgi:adenylosuccinate synthase
MSSGCGVPAGYVDKFIGVIKAYTTRVGEGPFPSEQDNQAGQKIREMGNEYGTTTGRPRRCGWFDAVAVSYSARIGSINELALLHLDTLTGFKELKICTAYKIDGKRVEFFPANSEKLFRAECIYETVEGWSEDLTNVKSFDDLPAKAKEYVKAVEQAVSRPVKIIGVGPKREQTIYR